MQEIGPIASTLLRNSNQRTDIVTRMGVISRQEGVVEIQLAHGRGVGPGSPFRLHCKIRRETEQSGAIGARMTKGLLSGGHHRPAR